MAVGELLGREQERAAIETFVGRALLGTETLLVEGEAGIGKTSIWDEAIQSAEARGLRVLSCRAAETEAKLSFSGLSDLLEPVPEESFEALPDPQRRALDVALLRVDAEGAPPDARAVATAVRSVLDGLAARTPTLVAVDDAQWLDRASDRSLDFALRRRGDQRLSLLVSRRPGGRAALAASLADADRMPLGPLSLGAVHELLKERLGRSLPRPQLVRVYSAARGNPFYALEIGRELLHAGVRPGDQLPVPDDLSRLVRRRVSRLPSNAQEALLVTALAAQPTPTLISAVLRTDSAPLLDQAEEADLVETRHATVHFLHPLFAAAVHGSATKQRRRHLHRRLAEVVADAEERGRHLALATDTPDEVVAQALDEAALHAKTRGALDAAAELTEHALRLTPPEAAGRTTDRMLQLGISLRLAGDTGRAHDVLAELAERTTGPLRSEVLVELAAILYWSEGAPAAVECCERALEAAGDDLQREAKVLADLAVYCEFDLERSLRCAEQALDLFAQLGSGADPNAHSEALATAAGRRLMLGQGLRRADLERAMEIESTAPQKGDAVVGRIQTASGKWLKYADDFDGSRELLEAVYRVAVEEGDESALPNILVHLAQTELWAGNWQLASQYAEESCEIAEQLGQRYGGPTAHRALVDAHLGRREPASRDATEGLRVHGEGLVACFNLRALGFLHLSQRDPAGAAPHLTRAVGLMESMRLLEPGVLKIHADAVEALVGGGELDRAGRLLDGWEQQTKRCGHPWSLATSARCRGLLQSVLGEPDEALRSIDRALVVHERLKMPFELGRTYLVKGRVERRAKHKAAAKESLEQALAIFEGLPAPLWSEQTHQELARVGLRRAADHLTETERRVAELAASGLTNREVATQLFLSPKTVEANLDRAYRKLGIRSRAELGARLGSVGSGAAQT